jgi:hypothetical protein
MRDEERGKREKDDIYTPTRFSSQSNLVSRRNKAGMTPEASDSKPAPATTDIILE